MIFICKCPAIDLILTGDDTKAATDREVVRTDDGQGVPAVQVQVTGLEIVAE